MPHSSDTDLGSDTNACGLALLARARPAAGASAQLDPRRVRRLSIPRDGAQLLNHDNRQGDRPTDRCTVDLPNP